VFTEGCAWTSPTGRALMGRMDPAAKHALDQIELGEAELAVLKQEQVLRELLSTGLPTADATARLAALRKAVERLLAGSAPQKRKPRGLRCGARNLCGLSEFFSYMRLPSFPRRKMRTLIPRRCALLLRASRSPARAPFSFAASISVAIAATAHRVGVRIGASCYKGCLMITLQPLPSGGGFLFLCAGDSHLITPPATYRPATRART
jgi:hypothetical protein